MFTNSLLSPEPDPPRPTAKLSRLWILVQLFLVSILTHLTVNLLTEDFRSGGFAHVVAMALVTGAWYLLGVFQGLTSSRLSGPVSAGSTVCDDRPLLDRLDRIAEALERRPAAAEPSKPDLSRITSAIAEKQWELAQGLLDEQADHPEAPRLSAKLAEAKKGTGDQLLGELKASQEVGDPVRVLQIREMLSALLAADFLRELDEGLAKWLMSVIMKRLRTGSVGPDVAELATQVADRFATTKEGASLRVSLPTLRRSAGLCARCARPYRGIADACPLCLKGTPLTVAASDSDDEVDEVQRLTRPEDSPFVDLTETD